MTGDLLTAALDQLAAHREQLAGLDAREARHFASLAGQLTQLADTITAVAKDQGVRAASLSAIGAFERATVGWFDLAAKVYRPIEVEEQHGEPGAAAPHPFESKL